MEACRQITRQYKRMHSWRNHVICTPVAGFSPSPVQWLWGKLPGRGCDTLGRSSASCDDRAAGWITCRMNFHCLRDGWQDEPDSEKRGAEKMWVNFQATELVSWQVFTSRQPDACEDFLIFEVTATRIIDGGWPTWVKQNSNILYNITACRFYRGRWHGTKYPGQKKTHQSG